jgi:hypothetical protein
MSLLNSQRKPDVFYRQDSLAEIDIQDLLPLVLDITGSFNEDSQIHLDNQSDKFFSNQLEVIDQPCNFQESNYLYQTYGFCQPNRFGSRTELAKNTSFDDPSCFHNPIGAKQSFYDFHLCCSSNLKTAESNWSLQQTQHSDKVWKTNAEKCKKYRDRK